MRWGEGGVGQGGLRRSPDSHTMTIVWKCGTDGEQDVADRAWNAASPQ